MVKHKDPLQSAVFCISVSQSITQSSDLGGFVFMQIWSTWNLELAFKGVYYASKSKLRVLNHINGQIIP